MPAALALALAGCDSTEPDLDVHGEMRFDHSGASTGSFTASGELPVDAAGVPTALPSSGAVAVVRAGRLMLMGVRGSGGASGGTTADALVVHIGGFTGVGNYSMDVAACGSQQTMPDCRVGAYMPGITLAQLRQAAEQGPNSVANVFVAGLGTVTVTQYGSGRIRGTFTLNAAAPPSGGFSSMTMTNGQFELPVK